MRPEFAGVHVVGLHIGGVYASGRAVAIRTVLGSCIAACLYDQEAGIGGMNHFMLPHPLRDDLELPARYGINAMELLINRIMSLGGFRRRLQAKLFGGANVLHTRHATPSVAERNAAFAREFLDRENIPLVSWRLGGCEAMEVVFFPDTARTLVKSVRKLTAAELAAREAQYESELDRRAVRPPDEDVTLF